VAAGKKANVIAKVMVPKSLLRRDSHDEAISSCYHHARFEKVAGPAVQA
jgi:hypothetical protein